MWRRNVNIKASYKLKEMRQMDGMFGKLLIFWLLLSYLPDVCSKISSVVEQQLRKMGDDEEVSENLEMSKDYLDFPVTVVTNSVLGRHLIAQRDLKAGEILLKEAPVFMAPNANGVASGDSTCLSCCLKVKNNKAIPCGRCGWPVCSRECEMDPQHKNNECEIFSENNIKPSLPSPYCFIASAEYIKVLRCLLISSGRSETDKQKWAQIQRLQAHAEERKKLSKILFMSTLCKTFVQRLCNFPQFDNDMIDFILGVVDVNAFRHTVHPDNPLRKEAVKANKDVDRNATFLYPKASMAAHGCRRNVRWETSPSTSLLQMWVAEDVPKGGLLTHPYVDLMQGTPTRRRQLKEQFYFDCTCPRCSDPTELGTFFSVLKCPDCVTGDLLAVDPLNYETNWKCGGCGCVKPFEYERQLVAEIQGETKEILDMLQGGMSNLEGVGRLARMLGKYRGKKVHPNHFTVIDVEYHLVRRMAKMSKPTVDLLQEMKKLILKFLDVAVVFYPGIK